MGDEQQQEQQQQQEEHEAVPDEDYRPKWVDELVADNKLLHGKVDALGKSTTQQPTQQPTEQPKRDTNGNPKTEVQATKVEVPASVVAPKAPSWLTRIPKWF